jgi:CIC family chloride channel protein
LDRAVASPVSAVAIAAPNITEAILNLARTLDSQVIVLGASRESLLKQALYGNLPAAIARHYTGTIVVVRGPLP